MSIRIPFNRPAVLPDTLGYVSQALASGHLSGMGAFTSKCEGWLEQHNRSKNLLVTSATHALEMMALLLDFQPGDELILPSFTFVSTANAFALRGAVLRFADNDEYGNISLTEVKRLLSPRTKAVMAVHYAGNSCNMRELAQICREAKVFLLEDAAQAIGSTFEGTALGSWGDLGCYSFHETKNISAGEGGALIVSPTQHSKAWVERAEILREKGTNRRKFLQQLTDKYTWVDFGSSYVLSELNAAYLYSQMTHFEKIQSERMRIWNRYAHELESVVSRLNGRILKTPPGNQPNAHLFALVFTEQKMRDDLILWMRERGILCPFHYVPLHRSPFGLSLTGGAGESLPQCEALAAGLIRLPLYFGLKDEEQSEIIDQIKKWGSQK